MSNGEVEQAKRHVAKLEQKGDITKNNKQNILDFVEQISAQGYSSNRQKKYLYALSVMSRMYGKDFDKVTTKEMNNLASKIRDKYNGETPRDYLVMLRIFIKYIWEQKGFEFDDNEFPEPVKKIKPGNRIQKKMLPTELLSINEVKSLANHTYNLRDRCFILVLYETGARIGELIGDDTYPGLRLKDIEFDKYGCLVTIMGKTGSRKLRLIASAPAISNWLDEHPNREKKNSQLFCGIWTNRGGQIQYRYWNKLLKKIGEKSKVDKPMNPHHFRHSRATDLAKYMTESQLNYYMGWIQGSKQARTYVHLSGRDNEKTILAMHGIIVKEKQETDNKPFECPRCGIMNDSAAKFCHGCSLGLDEKSMMEYDQEKEQATKLGFASQDMLKDPEFRDFYNEMLLTTIEKYKEMKEKK